MSALLALCSALLLGVWKFGIGRYRGRVSVYTVVLISASTAALTYALVGQQSQELTFGASDVVPGFLGGTCNLLGTLLVLKAFERGKLGVITGVAAACTLVPLAYSLIVGDEITWFIAIGIALVLGGLVTFYVPNMRHASGDGAKASGGIALAAIAALFWGVAIVVLDLGARVSVTGTLLISEVPQVAFTLVAVVVITRPWAEVTRHSLLLIAGAGVALGLGNIAFFTAADLGDVGVVSVLASLSPMVVAVMAFAFLKEPLTRSEMLALVIVLAGTSFVVA